MTLTLLSPTRQRLEVLRDEWKKVVEDAGLEAGVQDENLAEAARRKGIPDLLGDRLDVEELADVPLLPDKAPANGSTIAVLAEFDGKSCLLTGDAHPDVFEEGLERLCRDRRNERHRRDGAQGAPPRQPAQRVEGRARPDRDRPLPVLDERHARRSIRISRAWRARSCAAASRRSTSTTRWRRPRPGTTGGYSEKHKYKAIYPEPGTNGLTVDL